MGNVLTKSQKQDLGRVLESAGYDPLAFVCDEIPEKSDTPDTFILTNRETNDTFTVVRSGSNNNRYYVTEAIPGSSRTARYSNVTWETVCDYLSSWAGEVKHESEAIDPWEVEAERMSEDDGYFALEDLPQVEKAIEDSLQDLKSNALEFGITQERIESELGEMKALLIKSARTNTKKEWLSIFKGAIVGKLIDWGMETALFHHVLQTLITSAHNVPLLVEHATRLLPT